MIVYKISIEKNAFRDLNKYISQYNEGRLKENTEFNTISPNPIMEINEEQENMENITDFQVFHLEFRFNSLKTFVSKWFDGQNKPYDVLSSSIDGDKIIIKTKKQIIELLPIKKYD